MWERTEWQSNVSSYFTEHAASWRQRYGSGGFDAWEYQTRGRIALEWLAAPGIVTRGRLLEIGCGAGVQSAAAAKQGWSVVAVDFAEGMLVQARCHSQEPAWAAAVVEALPFPAHTFDAILMNGVIGYVQDPQQAVCAVREQLRPGGRFIVSWASPHPLLCEAVSRVVSAIPDAIYLGLKHLVTRRPRVEPVSGPGFYSRYLQRWTPEEFYGMLESAGFKLERVRSQNFGQFRLMDHPVWPERVDIQLSEWLDRLAGTTPHRRLRDGARTHIAWATAGS